MIICRSIQEVRDWRAQQPSVAFVPTMGNLHQGHLELCRLAQQQANQVMVSIFVNPLQFGPQEDFQNYPRSETADLEKLQSLGVDAVFIPAVEELFPAKNYASKITVNPDLSNDLCGKSRPGHFTGVTTIVAKLLHIVQPQVMVLGEKDYQQLTLLRQMVADLNLATVVTSGATVRAPDGLALSSRNAYLSEQERQVAPQLQQCLQQIRGAVSSGATDYSSLLEKAQQSLTQAGFQVDYLEIRCASCLKKLTADTSGKIVLVAAKLGRTRLIDNLLLT